ncbi:MAG: hypothetical protein NUW37_07365 [Planctomycetes bacterium]|nr:hypothetical protein [Planctomycetota bacterium]
MKHALVLVMLVICFTQVAKAQERLPQVKISLFHFNVQYVCGDTECEDNIIKASLGTLLDDLLAHPKWKMSIEIQGYGIEVMRDRHPEVLEKLRKAVDGGQAELIVTHYSDQWFIGYPGADMKRSVELSRKALESVGLKHSGVFSGQEMQWAPGLPEVLGSEYHTYMASSGISSYGGFDNDYYLADNGTDEKAFILTHRGLGNLPVANASWGFYDDGENWNTLISINRFRLFPPRRTINVRDWETLEAGGHEFWFLSDLVKKIREYHSSEGTAIPAIPDSHGVTWQMGDAGPHLWMGRRLVAKERDGEVRARPYRSRGLHRLAETLAPRDGRLDDALKHILLAEVSDSSGWRPEPGEVQYTFDESDKADGILQEVFNSWATPERAGKVFEVRTASGAVRAMSGPPQVSGQSLQEVPAATLHPRIEAENCKVRIGYELIANGTEKATVTVTPDSDAAFRYKLTFETPGRSVFASRELIDLAPREIPAPAREELSLAIPDGIFGMSDRAWLVKDCQERHLSVQWRPAEGAASMEEFVGLETPAFTFSFYLTISANTAKFLAEELNVNPRYYVAVPSAGVASVQRATGRYLFAQ